MRTCLRGAAIFLFLGLIAFVLAPVSAFAEAGATSGLITGTVTDPSGSVVAGATVTIQNPVTQYERATTSDSSGHFQFTNVPYESYHMTVRIKGFGTFVHDVSVHSATPVSADSVWNIGLYYRRDGYNYYPSKDPFADLGPIQEQTIGQDRSLANAGLHTDFSYEKGHHNIKIGGVYEQTFLNENDTLGIVDPGYLDTLTDANGNPACPAGRRTCPLMLPAPICTPTI
jgi:hypothetical protein